MSLIDALTALAPVIGGLLHVIAAVIQARAKRFEQTHGGDIDESRR